jgi:hypothetical protein
MPRLVALKITKAQLEAIPKDDRTFYFIAGQILNDINILTKLILAARNEFVLSGGEIAKRSAANAQLMLLLKLTAGRLYEAHKGINRSFSAKGFLKKYEAELPPGALARLKEVNKYFGKKSVIEHIRQHFGFHILSDRFEQEYNELPDDFVSTELLSERFLGHNLFHMSETLTLLGMLGPDKDNWEDRLYAMVDEITRICVIMGRFLQSFTEFFLTKYFADEKGLLPVAAIQVSDDPTIDDVRLPYFSEPPREANGGGT